MKLVNNIILFGIFTLSSTALGLEFDYGKEKTYKRPVRKISIIVDERSYYPENIIAFAGEEVQFFITGTNERAGCFLLPEKEIFLSARKGAISRTSVIFEIPGVYKFHCPKGKMEGHLTVLLHPNDKKKRELRELASKKVIKVWRPKEE